MISNFFCHAKCLLPSFTYPHPNSHFYQPHHYHSTIAYPSSDHRHSHLTPSNHICPPTDFFESHISFGSLPLFSFPRVSYFLPLPPITKPSFSKFLFLGALFLRFRPPPARSPSPVTPLFFSRYFCNPTDAGAHFLHPPTWCFPDLLKYPSFW